MAASIFFEQSLRFRSMQCAKTLEWDKLTSYLALECETIAARAQVLAIDWQLTAEESKHLLLETEEAHVLFRQNAFPSLTRLPLLTEALTRTKAGAALSIGELLNLKTLFELARRVKSSVDLLSLEDFPEFAKFRPRLNAHEKLVDAINHDLEDDGRVRDDASTELSTLRRELLRLEARIKEDLSKLIHSSTISKALQEPIFTQRNGRYVVPVIAASRGVVAGIVHDTSLSGMTVFIEPAQIIEDTNRTRMVALEIEREIERILAILSAKVCAEFDSIESSYNAIVSLDLIFSRARFGAKYDGIIPTLLEKPGFDLLAAKHPLLILQKKVEQVIGNDVRLGKFDGGEDVPLKTLVVTGPNTGGKTVLLKTVGLLMLMLKAGLMIPVAKGSSAFLFKSVFADIGDEQSLEQSLSTFSSHLIHVIEIVDNAREGGLVLLDELGAGTDPREGSALAQATLEHLNSSGCLTLITTHVSELKMLAYSQAGFANASFEFDAEHFRPTYRFKLGIPGASQAAKIARRLGLNQTIIERTENLLDNSKSDLDELIRNLENRLAKAIEREGEATKREEEARALASSLANKLESLEAQGQRAKSELAAKITADFEATQNSIKELTARLQREPNLAKARAAQTQLAELRQELGWLNEGKKDDPSESPAFKEGDLVFVPALNQRGRIERIAREPGGDKPAQVEVRVGSLKFVVSSLELKPLSSREQNGRPRSAAGKKYDSLKGSAQSDRRGGRPRSIGQTASMPVFVQTDSNTLDLRGTRVENALSLLDNFLDSALAGGLSPLMVIHGHGTGALKQAVRDELGRTNYPVEFRSGESYEGGDGVTMVSLK